MIPALLSGTANSTIQSERNDLMKKFISEQVQTQQISDDGIHTSSNSRANVLANKAPHNNLTDLSQTAHNMGVKTPEQIKEQSQGQITNSGRAVNRGRAHINRNKDVIGMKQEIIKNNAASKQKQGLDKINN